VSFTAITLYVVSQRVFIVVVYFVVIDSVRKLLDTPPYLWPSFFLDRGSLKQKESKSDRKVRYFLSPSNVLSVLLLMSGKVCDYASSLEMGILLIIM